MRLKGYDYRRAGAYFVTMVTYRREDLFGKIVEGVMRRSALGRAVDARWYALPRWRPYVRLDAHVVMPDHFHGIVWIVPPGEEVDPDGHHARAGSDRYGTPLRSFGQPVARSLATIVGTFKATSTKRVNRIRRTPGARVWQRNYHEHIVRDERALRAIRRCIAENPRRWWEKHGCPSRRSGRR